LRVRERSSCFATTWAISLMICSTPVTFASPCSKAARQCLILPSTASSLKCERETVRRTLESEAMSFATLGPGSSTR